MLPVASGQVVPMGGGQVWAWRVAALGSGLTANWSRGLSATGMIHSRVGPRTGGTSWEVAHVGAWADGTGARVTQVRRAEVQPQSGVARGPPPCTRERSDYLAVVVSPRERYVLLKPSSGAQIPTKNSNTNTRDSPHNPVSLFGPLTFPKRPRESERFFFPKRPPGVGAIFFSQNVHQEAPLRSRPGSLLLNRLLGEEQKKGQEGAGQAVQGGDQLKTQCMVSVVMRPSWPTTGDR